MKQRTPQQSSIFASTGVGKVTWWVPLTWTVSNCGHVHPSKMYKIIIIMCTVINIIVNHHSYSRYPYQSCSLKIDWCHDSNDHRHYPYFSLFITIYHLKWYHDSCLIPIDPDWSSLTDFDPPGPWSSPSNVHVHTSGQCPHTHPMFHVFQWVLWKNMYMDT